MAYENTSMKFQLPCSEKSLTIFSCLRRGIASALLVTLFSCGAAERKDLVNSFNTPAAQATAVPTVAPTPIVAATETPAPEIKETEKVEAVATVAPVAKVAVEESDVVTVKVRTYRVDCLPENNNGEMYAWAIETRPAANGNWVLDSLHTSRENAKKKRAVLMANGASYTNLRLSNYFESDCFITTGW